MNVKKILIIISYVAVSVISFVIAGKLQEHDLSTALESVRSGADNLEQLRRERDNIDRGFERTIAEQKRSIADRRKELDDTNKTIDRLKNNSGTRSDSVKRLEEIHREFERRYSEAERKDIILEKNDID